jgi:hypothetical protein
VSGPKPLPHAAAAGKEGEKKEEVGKGKQQIIESKRRLFRVKHKTDTDVTSVRVGGDDRENAHRIQEEHTRQVRGRHAPCKLLCALHHDGCAPHLHLS